MSAAFVCSVHARRQAELSSPLQRAAPANQVGPLACVLHKHPPLLALAAHSRRQARLSARSAGGCCCCCTCPQVAAGAAAARHHSRARPNCIAQAALASCVVCQPRSLCVCCAGGWRLSPERRRCLAPCPTITSMLLHTRLAARAGAGRLASARTRRCWQEHRAERTTLCRRLLTACRVPRQPVRRWLEHSTDRCGVCVAAHRSQ